MSEYWLAMNNDTNATLCDKRLLLTCPHCGAKTAATVISTPRLEQVHRYKPQKVIGGFMCQACGEAIALRFWTNITPEGRLYLSEEYAELERKMESFDYQYLPPSVAADFKEALTCFSMSCYNATAAMCRRTIQSVATDLGAVGTSKVSKQILEAKETAGLDEQTFTEINQLVLDGHDGAHPHLPVVTASRAAVVVAIMKDVLDQIYARRARIQKAADLRQESIAAKKSE